MLALSLRQLTSLIIALLLASLLLPQSEVVAARRQPATTAYVEGAVIVRLRPGVLMRQLALQHRLQHDPAQTASLDGLPIYRFLITDQQSPAQKALELMGDGRVLYAEPDYLVAAPEANQRSSWAVGNDDPNNSPEAAQRSSWAVGEADESTEPTEVDEADEAEASDDPQAAQRSSWAVGEGGDPALAYANQWALAATGLPTAHTLQRGAGVIVAVLDTGVDPDHPALAGRLLPGYDFLDQDSDPSELATDPDGRAYGHGTHVAGLIALAAPEASLLPLRTLDANGVGTIWAQAQAIWYATQHGADVINLSWSMPEESRLIDDLLGLATCRSVLLSSCKAAERPGAVIVAAAGNSGDSTSLYPGSSRVPGLLTVAASSADGQLAAFSTFGAWVELAAPGDQIISAVPGGGYASWSGTSMATPLAAGAVALLRASEPNLIPTVAVNRMTVTAVTSSDSVRRHLNVPAALLVR